MYLFFFLVILYSCTDEDLFNEAVGLDKDHIVNPYSEDSFGSFGTDSIPTTETDSLTDEKDSTEDESANKSPVARSSANPSSGFAPLQVSFTGSSSSDDHGIESYHWDFPDDTSSEANTTYTFNDPGIYNVTLTVIDSAGLEDTSSLTITVNEQVQDDPDENIDENNIPCSAGGGKAHESGQKVWCWENVQLTESTNSDSNSFSNGELRTSNHCNTGMATISGNRVYFNVNPTSPAPQNWCNANYNYRSEIRTAPSNADHPIGTEEWMGWDYTFGEDYLVDLSTPWIFWQVHGSFSSPPNPLVALWIATKDMNGQTNSPGEIMVVNSAQNAANPLYVPTGIVPVAGENLKIVVHVVWGTEANGLLEVWINGSSVYSKQIRTVYAEQPMGGYAKWGIYKWRWKHLENVTNSANQGISELNTSMGPLRIITRTQSDPDYGKNSYSLVAPD